MNSAYLKTARLLTRVAPIVLQSGVFALKGGTAINLFIRDMPRLSVDLDLVLPDHALSRDQALERISESLGESAKRLQKLGFAVNMVSVPKAGDTKLLARQDRIEIKVEANFVLRGLVGAVATKALTEQAQNILQAEIEVPVASLEDIYGGKLVAALDRQHPRDLFDVMQLYGHEGITPAIRRALVVYIASHPRPVHEVLAPKLRDISRDYEGGFKGMTAEEVGLDRLLSTRERLIGDIQRDLDIDERRFLISLVNAAPDWKLLGVPHAQELPAVRWKITNLEKLKATDPKKFSEQATALATLLER